MNKDLVGPKRFHLDNELRCALRVNPETGYHTEPGSSLGMQMKAARKLCEGHVPGWMLITGTPPSNPRSKNVLKARGKRLERYFELIGALPEIFGPDPPEDADKFLSRVGGKRKSAWRRLLGRCWRLMQTLPQLLSTKWSEAFPSNRPRDEERNEARCKVARVVDGLEKLAEFIESLPIGERLHFSVHAVSFVGPAFGYLGGPDGTVEPAGRIYGFRRAFQAILPRFHTIILESHREASELIVRCHEWHQISLRRQLQESRPKKCTSLIGLAFSGGGIRSACFNLGILEALKEKNVLPLFDYLSTVSGGGYAGAWLSGNCYKRTEDKEPDKKRKAQWLEVKGESWAASIRHLRRYSNYLTPRVGLVSADTWTVAMVWLRNTSLIQLIMVLGLACVLLLPRLAKELFDVWPASDFRVLTYIFLAVATLGIAFNQRFVSQSVEEGGQMPPVSGVLSGGLDKSHYWRCGIAFVVLLGVQVYLSKVDHVTSMLRVASLAIGGFWANSIATLVLSAFWLGIMISAYCLIPFVWRKTIRGPSEGYPPPYGQGWVQSWIVLPLVVCALFVSAVLQFDSAISLKHGFESVWNDAYGLWVRPLSFFFVCIFLINYTSLPRKPKQQAEGRLKSFFDWRNVWRSSLVTLACGVVFYACLCGIALLFQAIYTSSCETWVHFILGPSAVLGAFTATIILQIGLSGASMLDANREWWSRLGAWLNIYLAGWMVITVAATHGPFAVAWAISLSVSWVPPLLTWASITAGGLLAGNSASTSGAKEAKTVSAALLERLTTLAPLVYLAGLLIGVSTLVHLLLTQLATGWGRFAKDHDSHLVQLSSPSALYLWALLGIAGFLLGVLLFRVDINEFSLNNFYRHRLMRCFLGATRAAKWRKEQRFTGFDACDDIELAELSQDKKKYTGPYPLINCAVNLGGASDLELHSRMAASFILSPCFCGSSRVAIGYCATNQYGSGRGPTLAQAISISGAAANPNMGYHTSPLVAFLLTAFNVRLGWWLPNPTKTTARGRRSPILSARYLAKELFGGAGENSNFLNLSDGGHFENLAIYELIRRGCRMIVAGDAECDGAMNFESLGKLVSKCRTDFGVEISINVDSIRRDPKTGLSHSHCAVGRIHYANGDEGYLVYLKSSLTGQEGVAVRQYLGVNPAFPHESTGDQFFSEDQFESYRALGRQVAQATFAHIKPEDFCEIDKLGATLYALWTPRLETGSGFQSNAESLRQFWGELAGSTKHVELGSPNDPGSFAWPDEATAPSFYRACQMIQMMENVFLDLDLDRTWGHPDHAGWRQLFKAWAVSSNLKDVWKATRTTYGERFRYFCMFRLKWPNQ